MAVYYTNYITINGYKTNKFTINGTKYSFGKNLDGYILVNNVKFKGDTYIYKEASSEGTSSSTNNLSGLNTNTSGNVSTDTNSEETLNSLFDQRNYLDVTTPGVHLYDDDNIGLYELKVAKITNLIDTPTNWEPLDVYTAYQLGDIVAIQCVPYAPVIFQGWKDSIENIKKILITLTFINNCYIYKEGIYCYRVHPKISGSMYTHLNNRGPYKLLVNVYPSKAGVVLAYYGAVNSANIIKTENTGIWNVADSGTYVLTACNNPGYELDKWYRYTRAGTFKYNGVVNGKQTVTFILKEELTLETLGGQSINPLSDYYAQSIHKDLSYTAVFKKVGESNKELNTLGFSDEYAGTASIFDLTPHLYYTIDEGNTWFPIKEKGFYNNRMYKLMDNPENCYITFRLVYTYKNSTNFDILEPYFKLLEASPNVSHHEDMYANWTGSADINDDLGLPEYWEVWEGYGASEYIGLGSQSEVEFYNLKATEISHKSIKSVPGHDYIFTSKYWAVNEDGTLKKTSYGLPYNYVYAFSLVKTDEEGQIIDNLNGDYVIPKKLLGVYNWEHYNYNDKYEPSIWKNYKILCLTFLLKNTFKFWMFNTPKTDYVLYSGAAANTWNARSVSYTHYLNYTITGGTILGNRGGKYNLNYEFLIDKTDTEHFQKRENPHDEYKDKRQWEYYTATNIINPDKDYRMSLHIALFPLYQRISALDPYPKITTKAGALLHSNAVVDVTNPYIITPTKAKILNIYDPDDILWETDDISNFTIECPSGVTINKTSEGFEIPLDSAYNGLYKIKCTKGQYSTVYPFTVDI